MLVSGLPRCQWSSGELPSLGVWCLYPIQKVSEIYNKVTEMYNKVSELEISSWNVLFLLGFEVAYIGTEPILS